MLMMMAVAVMVMVMAKDKEQGRSECVVSGRHELSALTCR